MSEVTKELFFYQNLTNDGIDNTCFIGLCKNNNKVLCV